MTSIQELIKSASVKRILNNFPLFGTYPGDSNIATLNIPLGTSQTITYPAIVDEDITKVSVKQEIKKIPYASEIIKEQ